MTKDIISAAMEEAIEKCLGKSEEMRLAFELKRFPGVARILRERIRQVDEKGYTLGHDDTHADGEMSAMASVLLATQSDSAGAWPIIADEPKKWAEHVVEKWGGQPGRLLDIAGALVAAEIERLERAGARSSDSPPSLTR